MLSASADNTGANDGLVCLEDGQVKVVPFQELRDPITQRTRVRQVDIHSESYHVARDYMIRLEKEDLADPDMKNRLAMAAKMSPDEFERRFAPVVGPSGADD